MRGELTRQIAALPRAEALKILRTADYGVLATVNALGEPSVVALNHVLIDEETLVFHCKQEGEKIDNIRQNPAVSFFVLGEEEVRPTEFETAYTSVVAHGSAQLVTEEGEKRKYLAALVDRFVGDAVSADKKADCVEKGVAITAIIKMTIENLTGKARPAAVAGE